MSANPSNSLRSPEITPLSQAAINSNPALEAREHESSQEHSQIIIEAEAGHRLDFPDLWRYRELLYFLIWRDVKIKYKQTVLGAAWAIIQPLFAMLLFSLVFGRLAKMPSDGVPYALFAYAGLLPWTFFSNAVINSGNSLVGSVSLITKVYFPRVIIPTAAVAAGLLDLAIACLLLVPMLFYYDLAVGWRILMLPLFILLATLLALAVGIWMSAQNVKYRDVRYALPFLIQLWLFASPVIYPSSILPEKWKWVLALNPMTGIIEGFRASLFGRNFDWFQIAIAAGLTLILLLSSAFVFRRVEDTFADVI
jgi:lipopolysaccharide transport system permease protein